MKKIYLLLFLFGVLPCCNKETSVLTSKGSASFSLSSQERNDGRIAQTTTPAFVLLSIEDANGKIIIQNKKLSLVSFGQGYVSENLELSEGAYKLVQFLVLNANDTAIYAAPLAGSELSKYVNNPLPISFTIIKDASTQVVPEVLPITPTDVPENFGYVNFGFKVMNSVEIKMPIAQIVDKPDSMVVIASNGFKKVVNRFNIYDTYASVNLNGLTGTYVIEVRTFKKDNTNINTWYGKPLWQDPANQNNAITARLSSQYYSTINTDVDKTVIIPSHLNKLFWKDFFFNTLKKGIGLFFSQDPWGFFLEVDVPDVLEISYLSINKDIYWLNKQGSGYQDQGTTKWDYCNNSNICSYPLSGNNVYQFSIPKTNVLNEVSCHDIEVYIMCFEGKPAEFSDFKTMTFCTDKN